MYSPFYSVFFHNVSLWESLFVLQGVRDAVVTQFSHYKNWLQTPTHFLEAGCSPTYLDDVAMEAEQEVEGDLLS